MQIEFCVHPNRSESCVCDVVGWDVENIYLLPYNCRVQLLLLDVFPDAFEERAFAGKDHWSVEDVIWSVEESHRLRLPRVPGCSAHMVKNALERMVEANPPVRYLIVGA